MHRFAAGFKIGENAEFNQQDRDLASTEVKLRADRGEHNLEFTVQGGELREVRWDDHELPALTKPEVNGRLSKTDYVGDLGVINVRAASTFRNAQFMLLGRARQ